MIKQDSGFSLVELMVTIVIMAILAAIGATLFSTATSLARDAQRMKDLETIKQALELYRSDVHNYPTKSAVVFTGTGSITNGTTVYLSKVPIDSKSGQTYVYQPSPSACSSNCSSFILCAKKEGVETTYDVPLTHLCSGKSCGSGSCNIGISSQ